MTEENKLAEKRIALILEDGYNKNQFDLVKEALENSGAKVDRVSSEKRNVKPYTESNAVEPKQVDVNEAQLGKKVYDGVLIIDGVMDQLDITSHEKLRKFIDLEFEAHTPIAAIGSAGKALQESEVFDDLSRDVTKGGNSTIVKAQNVMYVREIDDKKKFSDELIEFFAKG